MSIIYTYHATCSEIAPWYAPDDLLSLWREEWKRHGYTPIVLTPEDAGRHPRFEEFAQAVADFPTTNPRKYEEACWYRWLALSSVGGGVMSDTDVLPRRHHDLEVGGPTIFSRDYRDGMRLCPCLFSGTGEQIDAIIDLMLYHSRDELSATHYSDQCFVRDWNGMFEDKVLCRTYGDPLWPTAPFIHYKTDALDLFSGGSKTKPAVIRAIRALDAKYHG